MSLKYCVLNLKRTILNLSSHHSGKIRLYISDRDVYKSFKRSCAIILSLVYYGLRNLIRPTVYHAITLREKELKIKQLLD